MSPDTSLEAFESFTATEKAASMKAVLRALLREPDSSRELARTMGMDYTSASAYTATLLQAGMLARGAKRTNTETGKSAYRLWVTERGMDALDGRVALPTGYRKVSLRREALAVAEAALEAHQHGLALPEPLNGLTALYAAAKASQGRGGGQAVGGGV